MTRARPLGRLALFTAPLLLALIALPAAAATARLGLPVMGTVLQVEVVAAESELARELCRAAITHARIYDDLLTTWRSEGELARLNGQAGEGQVKISKALHDALQRMLELSGATLGAFDPSVGRAVELWRQTAEERDSNAGISGTGGRAVQDEPEAGKGLARSLAVGTRQTEAGGNEHWAALSRGVRLDAGAIGKGMALDAMVELLRRRGASAAFLDFGGSSQAAFGRAESGRPWTVALPSLDGVAGTALLEDRALSTSLAAGPGSAAGPIIDPKSGRPVGPPRLATVVAADATLAEAWSTALVVLGREGLGPAAAAGVEAYFEDALGRSRSGGTQGLEEQGLDGPEEHH